MSASAAPFGRLPDGREVRLIRLKGGGLSAEVLTLGAILRDLRLEGVGPPLVLGFASPEAYLGAGIYVGALVGRFANRIGGARFALEGRTHDLDRNFRGRHLLHGGSDGIHRHLWEIAALEADQVLLTLALPDGHMGFPGALRIRARISLAEAALSFELTAESDAPTPCSLAHHGYFDLDGEGDVREHELRIAAESYLPVDADLIPTGEIAPVAGTAFDFRGPRRIGAGYDHNFCLARRRGPLREVARLTGRKGLSMAVETTEPGLQLYDGRHFDGSAGLEGRRYGPYAGVALEAQGWPDAPNHPQFPESVLRPGEVYRAATTYRFFS